MLGGLNHIQSIWLQRYINLLCFLSSRLPKTSTPRSVTFFCCNSRRISFMRRLRTYASGAYFIRPHISMLFCFHLGSPGPPSGALWGFCGRSLAPLNLFCMRSLRRSASGAYFILLFTFEGAYILCAGCGDPRPLPLVGAQGAYIICAGCGDLSRALTSHDHT